MFHIWHGLRAPLEFVPFVPGALHWEATLHLDASEMLKNYDGAGMNSSGNE
jgi:hypothetical protein